MIREEKKGNVTRWSVFICLFLLFWLSGYKSENITPVRPLQEVWTEYKTEEDLFAYTLDEDGNLYTPEYDVKVHEEPEWLTLEQPVQITQERVEQLNQKKTDHFFLRKYNAKGEQEYTKALEDSLASYVKTMAVKDGMVYFVPYTIMKGEMCAVLYSYFPETSELAVVKELSYFKSVSRIIPMGDSFYLLGTNVEGFQEKNSRKYEHAGEKLFCYTVSNDKFVELGFKEPMDICVAEEGRLFVYAHMGEEFCLVLYDTCRETMKVMARTKEYKMADVAFCSERQEVIYQTTDRGLVLSSFSDLEVESELYPDGFFGTIICVMSTELWHARQSLEASFNFI